MKVEGAVTGRPQKKVGDFVSVYDIDVLRVQATAARVDILRQASLSCDDSTFSFQTLLLRISSYHC